jgi:hypothetical protein
MLKKSSLFPFDHRIKSDLNAKDVAHVNQYVFSFAGRNYNRISGEALSQPLRPRLSPNRTEQKFQTGL